MALTLSPPQAAAAEILAKLKRLRSQYEQPAITLDEILNGIVALPNDPLAALGNEIGPVDLANLLTAHTGQVAGVNLLASAVELIISSIEQRAPGEIRTASTLTLYERLAQQNREIVETDGVFSVLGIPEPESPAE